MEGRDGTAGAAAATAGERRPRARAGHGTGVHRRRFVDPHRVGARRVGAASGDGVWIHGGSFTIGASSLRLRRSRLASEGDVVVVAINYRLGALGWMALDAHGGREWGAVANCGLLDQALALQWVRDHIGAYGGDPANVTVFGESAGGGLDPAPPRVARRPRWVRPGDRAERLDRPHAVGRAGGRGRPGGARGARVRALAAGTIQALELREIVAAQERATPKLFGVAGMLPFHPALDDDNLDRLRLPRSASVRRDVDLLLGVTTDEMRLFLDGAPALEAERLRAGASLPRARRRVDDDAARVVPVVVLPAQAAQHEPIDVWAAIFSDREMLVPAVAALDAHAAAGGRTFAYQFDWQLARARADGLELGACHGVDIPFTFATFSVDGWDAFVGADADPRGRMRLSAALHASWCGFARSGDPAHEGRRPVARISRASGRRCVSGVTAGVEHDPAAPRLSALAAAGVTP